MAVQNTELWKTRLEVPAYRVGEAASYARISPQTLADWEKTRASKRSVVSHRREREGLTFLQLIEVAVVAEIRREGVKLDRIRGARDYFAKKLCTNYPFATERFKTDGVDILQEVRDQDGQILRDRLIVANANGQLIWTEFLSSRLREFNYGEDGFVESWQVNGVQSDIVIDPKLSFGSPTIQGIMTRAIKNEWITGQRISEIAEDYDLTGKMVIEALRFEGVQLEGESENWVH